MDYYSKADRVIGNLLRGGQKQNLLFIPWVNVVCL